MERLKKDLHDEQTKSQEIEEQLRQISDNGNEQRAHMDNVNTRVRDFRQKKSDIAALKTYVVPRAALSHEPFLVAIWHVKKLSCTFSSARHETNYASAKTRCDR